MYKIKIYNFLSNIGLNLGHALASFATYRLLSNNKKSAVLSRVNWMLSRAERPWHSNWFLLDSNQRLNSSLCCSSTVKIIEDHHLQKKFQTLKIFENTVLERSKAQFRTRCVLNWASLYSISIFWRALFYSLWNSALILEVYTELFTQSFTLLLCFLFLISLMKLLQYKEQNFKTIITK